MEKIKKNTKKFNPETIALWYKVGKHLVNGRKLKYYKEGKVAARRTYLYYNKYGKTWDGPTPRKLGKMNKEEFNRLMGRDELKGGTLWEFDANLPQQSRDVVDTEYELGATDVPNQDIQASTNVTTPQQDQVITAEDLVIDTGDPEGSQGQLTQGQTGAEIGDLEGWIEDFMGTELQDPEGGEVWDYQIW